MPTLKLIHIICAYATGVGFLLRGILVVAQHPLSRHKVTRVLPHIIDTVLLISAIAMLAMWSLSISGNPWLIAKIVALFIYIAFGLLMLRFGTSPSTRMIGLIGGLLSYCYIIGAAHSKSALSVLAL